MNRSKSTSSNPSGKSKKHNRSQALFSAEQAARIAIEQKGLDVRVLDLQKVTDIADYFVIASGTSERHVQGLADKISEQLRSCGEERLSASGYQHGQWVLLDYGDVIVHIFYEPTRQYYQFDDLWKDAPEAELSPELEAEARKLRTGIYR